MDILHKWKNENTRRAYVKLRDSSGYVKDLADYASLNGKTAFWLAERIREAAEAHYQLALADVDWAHIASIYLNEAKKAAPSDERNELVTHYQCLAGDSLRALTAVTSFVCFLLNAETSEEKSG